MSKGSSWRMPSNRAYLCQSKGTYAVAGREPHMWASERPRYGQAGHLAWWAEELRTPIDSTGTAKDIIGKDHAREMVKIRRWTLRTFPNLRNF